jgi:hypothetical protein
MLLEIVLNTSADFIERGLKCRARKRNVLVVLLKLASKMLIHATLNKYEGLFAKSNGRACFLIQPDA